MTEDRLTNLRAVPIFSGLRVETLEQILDYATDFEAEAGHVLVQPNQPGAGLFVIEEGAVTVELKGRKIELGEGEFFGELALLDENAVHSGRVCAATPLRCLAIDRDRFDELLENEPSIAKTMLRVLAHRLAETNR